MNGYQPYFDAVKFLESLIPPPGSKHQRNHPDIFIKRTRALLGAVNYQFGKTKFIHLTGTAGKGSTANNIYQLLLKNSQRAGLFTSPFVTTTIERIAANGRYIDPLVFAKLTETIKPAIIAVQQNSGYGCPTYFECLLAIALLYFKQECCEYQVIEVGIGGRYDSTNIIPLPTVVAITNIGFDHTEILGKTLPKIAHDKAGIIKTNCQFFTTEKRSRLLSIFKRICQQQGAFFHSVAASPQSAEETNYDLAKTIVQSLGHMTVAPLINIRPLPARFELVNQSPRVIIDVAHNPAKMQCTAVNLAAQEYRQCHLVIGLSVNKDIEAIVKEIAPYVDSICVTAFRNAYRSAADPGVVANRIGKYTRRGVKAVIINYPVTAFRATLEKADKKDLVLVTGSFYLADNIRSLFIPEEEILKNRIG